MKKAALITLLATLYFNGYCQYGGVSFYVIAHPDQWQLFMGISAYNDINATVNGLPKKVVFIYATAGDQSCNGTPLNVPHYRARQDGANNCIEFCADRGGNHMQWATDKASIQGHTILRYTYKNIVSYCLRLPDGCSGHSMSGQSLQLLYDNTVPSMTPVDSSAAYIGWNDLVGTLRQIIINESDSISGIFLNTAETDTSVNKGDEPDHIYAGMLCMDAIDPLTNLTINLFQENSVASLPANLDDISIATNAALLSQLDYIRTENGLPTQWTPQNISYLSRSYFRTMKK